MTVLKSRNDAFLNSGMITVQYTANATANVVGNNSVSDINPSADYTIVNARVAQVWYGAGPSNSFWTVSRGGNVQLVLQGTGHLNLQAHNSVLTANSSDPLELTLTNAADDEGFIMIDLKTEIAPV